MENLFIIIYYHKHDMAYVDFKNLLRRIASDKLLRDKAFDIAINPKYYWYQRDIASMAYNFYNKKCYR